MLGLQRAPRAMQRPGDAAMPELRGLESFL